jgi:hypothetical protein
MTPVDRQEAALLHRLRDIGPLAVAYSGVPTGVGSRTGSRNSSVMVIGPLLSTAPT